MKPTYPTPATPSRRNLVYPAAPRMTVRSRIDDTPRTISRVVEGRGKPTLIREERSHLQQKFFSRPWELVEALRMIAGGGWFDFKITQFDSPDTKAAAMQAQYLFSQEV